MTPPFSVRTTPHFDRLLKKLSRGHRELPERYAQALQILRTDPSNRSGQYDIQKLEEVKLGEGQYRLRLGQWRFRYDIVRQEVVLHYCGLRREETYR